MGGEPAHVTYGATPKRETLFWFNAGDLVVVGLDVPDDPDSPVSDKDRVDLGYDEAMVRSIMARGVREPVIFRKRVGEEPPRSEIIAGRGRELATREAVRRMDEAGVPQSEWPLVPGIKVDKKATDKEVLAILIEENALRRQETVLSLARKAKRYLTVCLKEARDKNAGGDPTKEQVKAARAETAGVCGCNAKTLGDWMEIVDKLSPGVHKLIEQGKVAPYVALELMKGVPPEEQEGKMKEHIAAGRARGLAAQAEVEAGRSPAPEPAEASEGGEEGKEDRPALPGRRLLRKFREGFKDHVAGDASFSRAQVMNLLDFLVAGKPLRGSLRLAWKASTAPAPKQKKAAATA